MAVVLITTVQTPDPKRAVQPHVIRAIVQATAPLSATVQTNPPS